MDWGFWSATALLTLVSVGLMWLALRRGDAGGAQAYDVQVYRDQLAEVDRDTARGVLDPDEAYRARTEISRRILAADEGRMDVSEGPGKSATLVAGVFATVVIAGGGYWIYTSLGAPGYGDLGLKSRIAMAEESRLTRPTQAEAEAATPRRQVDASERVVELVTQLRDVLQDRPNDLRGHQLLAQYEGGLGNFRAAYEAQRKVVEIMGAQATAADIGAEAELMVLATNGYVSPEAEKIFDEALTLNPNLGSARYYLGQMYAQTGRHDIAFRLWRGLLERGPEEAPWIPPIRAQIGELAQLAGVNYIPPAANAVRGPTQDDIANAAEMNPAERMEMIRGMVGGLSDKLATEGGTPQEWAQLLRSLVVLGDYDQAKAVWDNAQEVFADTPEAMVPIIRAAQQAGLTQ